MNSGQLDMDSFDDRTHPRFFGQIPVMPWKRTFYCTECDTTFALKETHIDRGTGQRAHQVHDGRVSVSHLVTEVTK